MEAQSLPSPPSLLQSQLLPQSTCNQCGKKFQRKAHLLRHQQQHSGDRPYSCIFCAKTFKRSDVLRDHFSRCERRGSSEIPSSLERGRKRHACDECSRLKVKCDNNVPCRKCEEFGRTCVKSRAAAASSPETTTSVRSATTPDIAGSDRNSIGFLLNCPGDADFLREFPKHDTLSPNGKPAEFKPKFTNFIPIHNGFEPMVGEMSGPAMPVYNNFSQQVPMDPNLDNFLRSLEFSTLFEQETHNSGPLTGENMVTWPGPDMAFLDRAVLEQRAFNIREKLRYTALTMNQPHNPSAEVLGAIELITADKIAYWIKLFFRHWQKHAPMIHEPTFNPCTAALPVVLSVMSLGGMYSTETKDVDKLHLILDIVEAYIYSIPRIAEEYDLPDRQYVNHGEDTSLEWQKFQLEEVQGAYLMVVLQYWTGNPIARTRVRQQRYGRVVAIMRNLDMQTIHHPPNFVIKDQASFETWILKESYIRTTCLAMMLDAAFGIFNNVSPRWQWAEVDLSFPSSDIYFELANYSELISTQKYPVQKMKMKDAYLILHSTPDAEGRNLQRLRNSDLSPLDLQLLIHFLYSHTWRSLFCNPLINLPSASSPPLMQTVQPYKAAMTNWKSTWDAIRAASPPDEWEKLGFQRSSDQYYEAVRAIINVWERRGGRFPVLESDCEKGAHLKRLLSF